MFVSKVIARNRLPFNPREAMVPMARLNNEKTQAPYLIKSFLFTIRGIILSGIDTVRLSMYLDQMSF
jgi:hypothetical protein